MAARQYRRGNYGELLAEEYAYARSQGKRMVYCDKYKNIIPPSKMPVTIAMGKAIRLIGELSRNADAHGWGYVGVAAFDNKGRGSAINWDLYAFGKDMHDKRFLTIIQIREYSKRYKNSYPRVHKNYYLMGTNEDKTVFAHPIESRVVHDAIKKGRDPIVCAQNWMFGVDYAKCLRQGDVVAVPVRNKNMDGEQLASIEIMQSHRLDGDIIKKETRLYARNAMLIHNTHPSVSIGEQWHRIISGGRASTWKFVEPTAD